MGGSFSTYGDEERAYSVLVKEPDSKRALGISRHRWQNNIKMCLQVICGMGPE